MTVSKELDWIENEPEYIGPSDEGHTFFTLLVQAADAGRGMWDEQADKVAKIAYALQMEAILWIYAEGDNYYIDQFMLPSIDDALIKMWEIVGEEGEWPDYGTPEAIEFAEWILEQQPEDWREQAHVKYLENQLARLKG